MLYSRCFSACFEVLQTKTRKMSCKGAGFLGGDSPLRSCPWGTMGTLRKENMSSSEVVLKVVLGSGLKGGLQTVTKMASFEAKMKS